MLTSSSLPMFSGSMMSLCGQPDRAVGAVVDVHERAGLLAVAPDLDLVLARELGGDDLAADRGRRLLAAAVVGAFRAVDVVVARDAGGDAVVLAVVARHALAEQLLPAVAVLRQGGIGVLFLERGDVGVGLLVAVVDAGRRRIEEALGAGFLGGDQHVGADQHRQHALGLVGLDEAHAAHVGGEVVDHPARPWRRPGRARAGRGRPPGSRRPGCFWYHSPSGLHVDGADLRVAALLQDVDEMAADEATGAGDDDEIILGHVIEPFDV